MSHDITAAPAAGSSQADENGHALIRFEQVNLHFPKKGGFLTGEKTIHVLKDMDMSIRRGEILAIVGESGCGKTTMGKLITGLLRPTSGRVLYNGQDIRRPAGEREWKQAVQFVQQDSYAALNPTRTIYQSLYAPIKAHSRHMKRRQINEKIEEILSLMGLTPAEQYLRKYPHQLSGGQRQRILMARAVSLEPRLIVADEPVSMIDVSLRLSLLNLMQDLNKRLEVSFVYITHDLSTARYIAGSGRICVMYLGQIVELGEVDHLLQNPLHPYTKALIQAVPIPDPAQNTDRSIPLKSMELSSIEKRGEGCCFYERCLYGDEDCRRPVSLVETENGCLVRCRRLRALPIPQAGRKICRKAVIPGLSLQNENFGEDGSPP